MTFTPALRGTKQLYLLVTNHEGDYTANFLTQVGVITLLQVVSSLFVFPSSGSGSEQAFTTIYSDETAQIKTVYLISRAQPTTLQQQTHVSCVTISTRLTFSSQTMSALVTALRSLQDRLSLLAWAPSATGWSGIQATTDTLTTAADRFLICGRLSTFRCLAHATAPAKNARYPVVSLAAACPIFPRRRAYFDPTHVKRDRSRLTINDLLQMLPFQNAWNKTHSSQFS